ncbi:hypothetical protein BTR23_03030 [Alkalihalophilus pseudofirmus]|nr:hypothetical protein BTR23_03030 [Alkalihalophilus pseudofirmus]
MSLERLEEPKLELLFDLTVKVKAPSFVGTTPVGTRRIIQVSGGSFSGPMLQGEVIEGGDDWITVREDGTIIQDVRIMLRTEDGEIILMTYRGIRQGPEAVLKRLDNNEEVDPSEYYFRTSPIFETNSTKYEWLNRKVFVGTGKRVPGEARYSVYTVL